MDTDIAVLEAPNKIQAKIEYILSVAKLVSASSIY